MKKKVMAILDREEGYATRLMEVFNSKNRLGFQAEMFTSVEAYWEYMNQNQVEILLIGDSLMEKSIEHSAALVMVISEGSKVAEADEHQVIYKYQSSELIIRKVLECYAQEGQGTQHLCKPSMKIYGVYAPQGRRCKSGFAWNLAKWIGRERSVLYFNLTTFFAKGKLYEGNKELADIMYYVRHDFDNLIYLVGSVVSNLEGVDCMPPMKAVDDLINVPCEDWLKLIRIISGQSNYEAVVLDVEECVQQFYRLLEQCSEVYMPFMEGNKDVKRWELCEQYFKRMGAEDVWRKAKKLEVDKQYWKSGMENIINS